MPPATSESCAEIALCLMKNGSKGQGLEVAHLCSAACWQQPVLIAPGALCQEFVHIRCWRACLPQGVQAVHWHNCCLHSIKRLPQHLASMNSAEALTRQTAESCLSNHAVSLASALASYGSVAVPTLADGLAAGGHDLTYAFSKITT